MDKVFVPDDEGGKSIALPPKKRKIEDLVKIVPKDGVKDELERIKGFVMSVVESILNGELVNMHQSNMNKKFGRSIDDKLMLYIDLLWGTHGLKIVASNINMRQQLKQLLLVDYKFLERLRMPNRALYGDKYFTNYLWFYWMRLVKKGGTCIRKTELESQAVLTGPEYIKYFLALNWSNQQTFVDLVKEYGGVWKKIANVDQKNTNVNIAVTLGFNDLLFEYIFRPYCREDTETAIYFIILYNKWDYMARLLNDNLARRATNARDVVRVMLEQICSGILNVGYRRNDEMVSVFRSVAPFVCDIEVFDENDALETYLEMLKCYKYNVRLNRIETSGQFLYLITNGSESICEQFEIKWHTDGIDWWTPLVGSIGSFSLPILLNLYRIYVGKGYNKCIAHESMVDDCLECAQRAGITITFMSRFIDEMQNTPELGIDYSANDLPQCNAAQFDIEYHYNLATISVTNAPSFMIQRTKFAQCFGANKVCQYVFGPHEKIKVLMPFDERRLCEVVSLPPFILASLSSVTDCINIIPYLIKCYLAHLFIHMLKLQKETIVVGEDILTLFATLRSNVAESDILFELIPYIYCHLFDVAPLDV